MTYRNDLEAAKARIESLERERRELLEQHARLNGRLAPEAAQSSPPKQPARYRWWEENPSEHAPDPVLLGVVSIGGVVAFIIVMIVAAFQT